MQHKICNFIVLEVMNHSWKISSISALNLPLTGQPAGFGPRCHECFYPRAVAAEPDWGTNAAAKCPTVFLNSGGFFWGQEVYRAAGSSCPDGCSVERESPFCLTHAHWTHVGGPPTASRHQRPPSFCPPVPLGTGPNKFFRGFASPESVGRVKSAFRRQIRKFRMQPMAAEFLSLLSNGCGPAFLTGKFSHTCQTSGRLRMQSKIPI